MKVIVAHCSLGSLDESSSLVSAIDDALRQEGFEVQSLGLPPLDVANPLKWVASWRLLPIGGMAHSLLCLDPYSSILEHPNKSVWLLGGTDELLGTEMPAYLANVLRAGVREADAAFAPAAVTKQLRNRIGREFSELDAGALQVQRSGRRARSSRYKVLLKALRA